MKKLILLGLAFTFIVATASAQRGGDAGGRSRMGHHDPRVTRGEKFKMKKNDVRYHRTARHFKRDGHLSRSEKRRLYAMKRHDRHDAFRYKHNNRRRVF